MIPQSEARREIAAPSAKTGTMDAERFRRSFRTVYDENFSFVWRSIRRLGVEEAATEDAVQEVFLVAFRKQTDFDQLDSVRSWLFAVARRVAHDQRRTAQRKDPRKRSEQGGINPESLEHEGQPTPAEHAETNELSRLLHGMLEQIDEDKRQVFVLTELEEMTAPDVGRALGIKTDAVYSRLRRAREQFNRAVARYHMKANRRMP